jgi:glc operon protein GlcG
MQHALVVGVLAFVIAIPAQAQQATLDAKAAQAIISGCSARALAKGDQQAIAVVDTGGRVIAALRMDRAGFGKMDFAVAKAVAAAAWGFGTAGQADGSKDFPGFARAPHVETVPGGIPVLSADGRSRIGAVGVSGAAPADDVACAEAGIVAAGLRSSRN